MTVRLIRYINVVCYSRVLVSEVHAVDDLQICSGLYRSFRARKSFCVHVTKPVYFTIRVFF